MDPSLLLAQYKAISGISSEERKYLSKRIWRRKRHVKREAIESRPSRQLQQLAELLLGQASLHVRWDKLL